MLPVDKRFANGRRELDEMELPLKEKVRSPEPAVHEEFGSGEA
jgi:hypothetical protein